MGEADQEENHRPVPKVEKPQKALDTHRTHSTQQYLVLLVYYWRKAQNNALFVYGVQYSIYLCKVRIMYMFYTIRHRRPGGLACLIEQSLDDL